MTVSENKNSDSKSRTNFCPKCGRKGVYYIKQQYYRCRYCRAYMTSPTEKYSL